MFTFFALIRKYLPLLCTYTGTSCGTVALVPPKKKNISAVVLQLHVAAMHVICLLASLLFEQMNVSFIPCQIKLKIM